jgi:hypothetical protein
MPKGDVKHFFQFRQVEMTDGSELYEIVTPDGERVASGTDPGPLTTLEFELNGALTEAAEDHSDIEINCL